VAGTSNKRAIADFTSGVMTVGMSVFAPLHNRAELEGIDIVEKYPLTTSRKWPCSTLAFTADCRRLPPCIPVRTNGSHKEFDDTAFTESIISTARSAQHKFWAANLAR
jgi:hypothetical protein